jgi:hypothetical protein
MRDRRCALRGLPHRVTGERPRRPFAGKEPVRRSVHAPPLAQDREECRRQHHAAILMPLPILDAQDHPLAIDGAIQKTGSAQYTKRAPTKNQMVVLGPEGSAYWFMETSGAITFIWRKTGTVEVWTPVGSGFKSMINGMTPGVLTKLP